MKRSIILVGIKGSGKSTHGKALANHLKVPFYDIDALIEYFAKMPVRQVYLEKGLSWFMMMEEAVCKKLVASTENKSVVISTGGGICDNMPALLDLKGKGEIVFLKQDIATCVEKIMDKVTKNPDGTFSNIPAYVQKREPETREDIEKYLTECFSEREHIYSEVSDSVILLKKEASIDDNFKIILEALG